MADVPVVLTAEEALPLLSGPQSGGGDGEYIHTFRSTPFALVGADWKRADVVDAVKRSERIEVGGDMCRSMNHGLVVWDGDEPLFVQVDDEALGALLEGGRPPHD